MKFSYNWQFGRLDGVVLVWDWLCGIWALEFELKAPTMNEQFDPLCASRFGLKVDYVEPKFI